MAMGRSEGVQGELMATWAEMPRSPGHAFYDRLQELCGLPRASSRRGASFRPACGSSGTADRLPGLIGLGLPKIYI
jgi:hypothetical protein